MSDDDSDKVVQTSLDHNIDETPKRKTIPDERYEDNRLGARVARTPAPLSDTEATEGRSRTMQEIERVLANTSDTAGRQRLQQFGLNFLRGNDFRLRDMSRRIGRQMRLDLGHEIQRGPVNRRLRDFDIQSQTMRMVTANATLGSYQFQKNQVLPYMRKSLALGYKSVSVLKGIYGGISSLERSVVSKLEAIKLNTGASAPFKESLFTRLKDAVAAKSMERVATNISNVVMDGYDEKYKRYVSPRLSRLNQKMTLPGQRGGINGVSRALTRKLNRLRRDAVQVGSQDLTGLSWGSRLKATGAQAAAGILGGAVRVGQRFKLSGGINDFASSSLSDVTGKLDRLQPFAPTDPAHILARQMGDHQEGTGSNLPSVTDLRIEGLTQLLTSWKSESKDQLKSVVNHLSAIRDHVVPRQGVARARDRIVNRKLRSDRSSSSAPKPNSTIRRIASESPSGGESTKRGFLAWSKRVGGRAATRVAAPASAAAAAMGAASASTRADSGSDKPSSVMDALRDQVSSSLEDRLSDIHEQSAEDLRNRGSRLARRARITLRRARRAGGRGITGTVRGLFRGSASGVRGIGRFGARGLWGAAKAGGRGIFSLAKGPIGLSLAAGAGKYFFDKYTTGEANKVGNTLLSAAQYGGVGAQIGGFFGGVGALPGAAIGAGIGAVVANADFAAKALREVGDAGSSVISGLWSTIFGQSAIVKPDGTVVRREKTSLLGDLKVAFFGRKAKYSSSGDIISPERTNLIGSIQYGFQKLLFGDKFSNGEYRQGSSLVAMAYKGMEDAMSEFGRQVKALPDDLKKGFMTRVNQVSKAGRAAYKWSGDTISSGSKVAGQYLSSGADQAQQVTKTTGSRISDLYKNFSWKKAGDLASDGMKILPYLMNPVNFTTGLSNGILGWAVDSGYVDSPTSPYYNFVTECLNAYGIKSRDQYRFVHSLEISQDKVNKGQIKPFDDSDLSYMAGRFGFDPKNQDAVNYFKLWYKRRFMAVMAMVGQALRNNHLDFGSVLAADKKQIDAVILDLKKFLGTSDVRNLGLEPSPQAYNRYAKIGSSDPGGKSPSSMTKSQPYDPRSPQNRNSNNGAYGRNTFADIIGNEYSTPNAVNDNGSESLQAARRKAAMTQGGVVAQPEFKAAFQKLPPKLRKVVMASKPLQFVLWSTAIQHGPDTASAIFQRDYSEDLDEKGFIRSIYQDRSSRFANVASGDRTEAMRHLSEEQRYAMGIMDGTSKLDRATMGGMVNDVIDPNGGYIPNKPKGDVAGRAREAMQRLMAKNYSKNAAAGIVGNLIEESGLRVNAVGDGGRAFGIAQWHPDRQNAISRKFGKSVRAMTLAEQIDAVDWEMRSGNGVTGGRNLADELNRSRTPGEAAHLVMNKYERPAERVANGQRRAANANGVLETMGGAASPSAPAAPQNRPKPQQQPAKPTAPKAKPAPKPEHDMAQWAKAMQGHTEALNNFSKSQGQPSPLVTPTPPTTNTTNNTNISPFLAPAAKQDNFLVMSMRKAKTATGAN